MRDLILSPAGQPIRQRRIPFRAGTARLSRDCDAPHGRKGPTPSIREHSFGVVDTNGKQSRLAGWNHPGDDIYGMIARSHAVVDTMEQLLGGEVYHYHSKMMLKEPRGEGRVGMAPQDAATGIRTGVSIPTWPVA